jgi:hypothetical protein
MSFSERWASLPFWGKVILWLFFWPIMAFFPVFWGEGRMSRWLNRNSRYVPQKRWKMKIGGQTLYQKSDGTIVSRRSKNTKRHKR